MHHAGLLPIVKEVVEMLFCRGVIKVKLFITRLGLTCHLLIFLGFEMLLQLFVMQKPSSEIVFLQ